MSLKIGIYTCCLNELKHIDKWYDSCKDADEICILDTGSTDGSREKFKEYPKIKVVDAIINPWRFDMGFNFAMSLLSSDITICIRLDLDERLQPGWKDGLLKAWTPTTTRLRYPYVWNWLDDGSPGRQWYSDRISSRTNHFWRCWTHEGLCYIGKNETQTFTDDVKIYQYPDSKNKKDDLERLIQSVNEWPSDSRIKSYLAREYMYQGQNEKSTEVYKEFLTMSFDRIERGQALMNLSVTDPTNKEFWLKMAKIEIPTHREPLIGLAQLYYDTKNWPKCYEAAKAALDITIHPMDYTCTDDAWSWRPFDLASIAAWNLKLFKESLDHSRIASYKAPADKRLSNNFKLIEKFCIEHELIPQKSES